jgi:hypothetical protein
MDFMPFFKLFYCIHFTSLFFKWYKFLSSVLYIGIYFIWFWSKYLCFRLFPFSIPFLYFWGIHYFFSYNIYKILIIRLIGIVVIWMLFIKFKSFLNYTFTLCISI